MFNLKQNQKPVEDLEIADYKETIRLYTEATELAKVGGWEVNLVTNKISWTKITRDIHEVDETYKPDLESAINFYKPGHSRETISRLVKNAVEKGETYDTELQIITAKGNERWVRVKGKVELNKGKCIRIYGVFYDIHAEKLKDLELAYSQELFAQTFNNAPIGIIIVSTNGKVLNANNRVCDDTGYTKDELQQLSFIQILHGEDITKDHELMNQLVNGEINFYEVEKRFIHKQEYIIWMSISVSLVRDVNQKPMHFIMHLIDVTAKKETERLLKDERILLQTLIDNLPLNVYIKDVKSRKVLVNKMEAAYMNATKKEILGKNDFELFPHDSATLSIQEDNEVLSSGISMIDKETINRKHDGSETWFLSSKIPLRDQQNEIKGILGISYDITERKKYEQKLENLAIISERQNVKLTTLTQVVTRKIKTSYSNLFGFIQKLEKENFGDKQEVIDFLKTTLLSLADTLKDLNSLSIKE